MSDFGRETAHCRIRMGARPTTPQHHPRLTRAQLLTGRALRAKEDSSYGFVVCSSTPIRRPFDALPMDVQRLGADTAVEAPSRRRRVSVKVYLIAPREDIAPRYRDYQAAGLDLQLSWES
jgi:hypothetical protein